MIRVKNLPMGTLSVPVLVKDLYNRKKHETTIIVRLIEMSLDSVDGLDTVHPRSGWCTPQDSVKNI